MFRLFEKLLHPYPKVEPAPLTRSSSLLHRPVRGNILHGRPGGWTPKWRPRAAGGLYPRLCSHQSGGFLGESSEEEALAL